MECDFCHERDAVIFLEQMSNDGSKRKINICMECAVERGISPDPKNIEMSLGRIFKELAETSKKLGVSSSKVCPVCGNSLNTIRKKMLTGCPECYEIFKTDVREVLTKNGITEVYHGELPQRLTSVKTVINDRIALRNKLNSAVEAEDYEKAAMYRDYLKALENYPVSSADDDE